MPAKQEFQRALAPQHKGSMSLMRVMVLEEVERPFSKRNGTQGLESGLSVRDVSTEGPRCKSNLTYLWAPGERDRYKGKLRDRFITIGIGDLQPAFGGVVKVEGCIVSVEGPPIEPNGAPAAAAAKAK